MITATDKAKEFLAEAIKKVSIDTTKGECFRIAKGDQDKLAVVPGTQTDGDVAITHQDATVLVIESALADELGDRTLDVREAGQGQQVLSWT